MSILMPKKVKHRKWQKGRRRGLGVSWRGAEINFGSYGLKAMEEIWLSSRQIEASRRAILRYLKKGGKLWVRIFPDKPVCSKGEEVPLGGGKGNVHHYAFVVKPGRVLFELDGVKEELAREALEKAGDKLPIRTKFIKKQS
jgi:large subunit ribosomal protein L16